METRAGFRRIWFYEAGCEQGSGIWGIPALWILSAAHTKLSWLLTVFPKVGQASFKYTLIKKNEIYGGVWILHGRAKKPAASRSWAWGFPVFIENLFAAKEDLPA